MKRLFRRLRFVFFVIPVSVPIRWSSVFTVTAILLASAASSSFFGGNPIFAAAEQNSGDDLRNNKSSGFRYFNGLDELLAADSGVVVPVGTSTDGRQGQDQRQTEGEEGGWWRGAPLENFAWNRGTPKTLICHDFRGGYLPYERLVAGLWHLYLVFVAFVFAICPPHRLTSRRSQIINYTFDFNIPFQPHIPFHSIPMQSAICNYTYSQYFNNTCIIRNIAIDQIILEPGPKQYLYNNFDQNLVWYFWKSWLG